MKIQRKLPNVHSNRTYVQMYVQTEKEIVPIIAVGKSPIDNYNKVIEGALQRFGIAHPHITPNIPHIGGSGYEIVGVGKCSLEDKTWTFNEKTYRVGREDPRIDGHFDQMKEVFPELEFKVNTIYEQMVKQ